MTRELGRQTELEVTKQLEREVAADRFTGLDRMLIAEQQGREFSDLRPDQDMRDTFRQNRALLIERARKLERMGLATEIETGKWMVSPKAEAVLRELGERGDIIKSMHRALQREGLAEDRHPAGYIVHRENAQCATGVRRGDRSRLPVSEIFHYSNGASACAIRCTGRTSRDRDRAACRIGEGRTPARRSWFKRWRLFDTRRRLKPSCSHQ